MKLNIIQIDWLSIEGLLDSTKQKQKQQRINPGKYLKQLIHINQMQHQLLMELKDIVTLAFLCLPIS